MHLMIYTVYYSVLYLSRGLQQLCVFLEELDMEHSDRILAVIKERGFTPYRVAKDSGMPQSVFSEWKRKPTSKIYSGNLVLIADYLECSVDYLLGRTEDPEVHQK